MESIELIIPEVPLKQDLTIIYKGVEKDESQKESIHEIKVSKEEIMKSLRYFKRKINEINQQDELFIHDHFSFQNFQDFIHSISTKRIQINDKNYSEYYELSCKYEYYELQQEIKNFIEKRPDLKIIIDDLSQSNEHENSIDNLLLKEEIIAENLDVCLRSGLLNKIPFSKLNCILNSKKRVLIDHKLLFEFVINKFKNLDEKEITKNDKEGLEILPSCLDFCEMDDEQIGELIRIQNSMNIFNPKNSTERMNIFIKENFELKEKNEKLELKIDLLSSKFADFQKQIELTQQKQKNEFQKLINMSQQKQNIEINDRQEKYEKLVNELNDKIVKQETIIQQYKTEIQENQHKIEQQQDTIDKLYKQIENQQQITKNLAAEVKNELEIFPFSECNQFNGIINYLRKKSKGNILNEIEVTASSVDDNHYPQNVLNFDDDIYFESTQKLDSWLCFDFKTHLIEPTYYTIKKKKGKVYAVGWVIECSNDKTKWEIIDERKTSSFSEVTNCLSFSINTKRQCRYFRIRQTKALQDGFPYFIISSFEIFGKFLRVF